MFNVALIKSPMNWFFVAFAIATLSLLSHSLFNKD